MDDDHLSFSLPVKPPAESCVDRGVGKGKGGKGKGGKGKEGKGKGGKGGDKMSRRRNEEKGIWQVPGLSRKAEAHSEGGKKGVSSELPYCNDTCDELNDYEFPTASYEVGLTLSILSTPSSTVDALNTFFNSQIMKHLSVCSYDYMNHSRRRLQLEGSILEVLFNAMYDGTGNCAMMEYAPSLVGTCAKFTINTDITYDAGVPSQFEDQILAAIVAECDAITDLKEVEKTFDPCPLITVGYVDPDALPEEKPSTSPTAAITVEKTSRAPSTNPQNGAGGTGVATSGPAVAPTVSTEPPSVSSQPSVTPQPSPDDDTGGFAAGLGGGISVSTGEGDDDSELVIALGIGGVLLCLILLASYYRRGNDGSRKRDFMSLDDGDEDVDEGYLNETHEDTTFDSSSPGRPGIRPVIDVCEYSSSEDEESPTSIQEPPALYSIHKPLGESHLPQDVHKCTSATCDLCNRREMTEFVSIAPPQPPRSPETMPSNATRPYKATDFVSL